MLNELKERLLNIETIKAQPYLWGGGTVLLARFVGLIDIFIAGATIAAFASVVYGIYKLWKK